LTRFSALTLVAVVLSTSAGCSNDGPVASPGSPVPRKLSESEVAEIKLKAKSSQELRKMIRARELGQPDVVTARKQPPKRPGSGR
jgi:hypothetical protein